MTKEIIKRMTKNIHVIIYIVLFLFGLGMILVAPINVHLDNKHSKGYIETTASYYSFSTEFNKVKFVTEYTGLYTFEVNGENYKIESKEKRSDPDLYKKTIKVKYDPSNPNAYIIEYTYYKYILIGLCIWVILFFFLRDGYLAEKKGIEYSATHNN